jgi:hypothetical protein
MSYIISHKRHDIVLEFLVAIICRFNVKADHQKAMN